MKQILGVISVFLIVILMLAYFPTNYANAATNYEQMKNSTVTYDGTSELFSLELNTLMNRLIFRATYNSNPTIVQSYHTIGFYVSKSKSSGGKTLNIPEKERTFVDLMGELDGGIEQHEYYTTATESRDTYTFTAKQIIDALHYLFPGEDLT